MDNENTVFKELKQFKARILQKGQPRASTEDEKSLVPLKIQDIIEKDTHKAIGWKEHRYITCHGIIVGETDAAGFVKDNKGNIKQFSNNKQRDKDLQKWFEMYERIYPLISQINVASGYFPNLMSTTAAQFILKKAEPSTYLLIPARNERCFQLIYVDEKKQLNSRQFRFEKDHIAQIYNDTVLNKYENIKPILQSTALRTSIELPKDITPYGILSQDKMPKFLELLDELLKHSKTDKKSACPYLLKYEEDVYQITKKEPLNEKQEAILVKFKITGGYINLLTNDKSQEFSYDPLALLEEMQSYMSSTSCCVM